MAFNEKLELDDYRDRLLDLINQGLNSRDIALALGVSDSTISKWRKQLGISPKSSYRLPNAYLTEIEYMYIDLGMKQKDIAKELGISIYTVQNTIHNHRFIKANYCENGIDNKELHPIEDPIYYVEHKPTMEKCKYHGKQYSDMTYGIIGG